jgi:hypothetical protein
MKKRHKKNFNSIILISLLTYMDSFLACMRPFGKNKILKCSVIPANIGNNNNLC